MRVLQQPTAGGVTDHVGRTGIWILSVNDKADKPGRSSCDPSYRLLVRQALGRRIDQSDAKPLRAGTLRQQQRPGGWLDGGKILGEGLIGRGGGISVNEENIKRSSHGRRKLGGNGQTVLTSAQRRGMRVALRSG